MSGSLLVNVGCSAKKYLFRLSIQEPFLAVEVYSACISSEAFDGTGSRGPHSPPGGLALANPRGINPTAQWEP